LEESYDEVESSGSLEQSLIFETDQILHSLDLAWGENSTD